MKGLRVFGLVVVGSVIGGLAVATVKHETAAVATPTAPLAYSGTLLGSNGTPATGSANIGITFFTGSNATGTTCPVAAVPVTLGAGGAFRVDTSICESFLDTQGAAFIQVTVNGQNIPASGTLPAVAAVPFARSAINAGSAAFAGNASSAAFAGSAGSAAFAGSAGTAATAESVSFENVTGPGTTAPVAMTSVNDLFGLGIQSSATLIAQFQFTAPFDGKALVFVRGACGIGGSSPNNFELGLLQGNSTCNPTSNNTGCAQQEEVGGAGGDNLAYTLEGSFDVVSGVNTFGLSGSAELSGVTCDAHFSALFAATTLSSNASP